jgi:hypothetical protein
VCVAYGSSGAGNRRSYYNPVSNEYRTGTGAFSAGRSQVAVAKLDRWVIMSRSLSEYCNSFYLE